MPKSLAEGKIRLLALPVRPADPKNITLAEAAAGVNISARINMEDYTLGPTGSEQVNEKELEKKGNLTTWGASNYEGSITPFLYIDPSTGQPDDDENEVMDLVGVKGRILFLMERENGKDSTEVEVVGDAYEYYEALTDDPRRVNMTGYIKRQVPLAIQEHASGVLVAA